MKAGAFIMAMILASCSSLSNKEKSLVLMGSAALVGGLIGSASTPEGESPAAHAAMWSGLSAAGAGIASLYLYDNEKEIKERERQIEVLQREISISRGEGNDSDPDPVTRSNSTLEAKVPSEVRHLIRPGKWELYHLDQWVTQGENQVVHQDKMFKLEPAQINVGFKRKEEN